MSTIPLMDSYGQQELPEHASEWHGDVYHPVNDFHLWDHHKFQHCLDEKIMALPHDWSVHILVAGTPLPCRWIVPSPLVVISSKIRRTGTSRKGKYQMRTWLEIFRRRLHDFDDQIFSKIWGSGTTKRAVDKTLLGSLVHRRVVRSTCRSWERASPYDHRISSKNWDTSTSRATNCSFVGVARQWRSELLQRTKPISKLFLHKWFLGRDKSTNLAGFGKFLNDHLLPNCWKANGIPTRLYSDRLHVVNLAHPWNNELLQGRWLVVEFS